jgi:hypothetical protein
LAPLLLLAVLLPRGAAQAGVVPSTTTWTATQRRSVSYHRLRKLGVCCRHFGLALSSRCKCTRFSSSALGCFKSSLRLLSNSAQLPDVHWFKIDACDIPWLDISEANRGEETSFPKFVHKTMKAFK